MGSTNIKRILIPVDFSKAGESAIDYGAYLAKLFNAEILFIHILEDLHKYPVHWFYEASQVASTSLIYNKVSEKLLDYSARIKGKFTINVACLLAHGKPAYKIAEAVEQYDIDVIIMGTHGTGGFEEFFLGSNAHKVVNLAPCPVITIREGFKPAEIKSIVFPIDESLHSRQKFNEVLPIATKSHATIHVLGIIQFTDDLNEAKMKIKMESVEKLLRNAGLQSTRKIIKSSNVGMEAVHYAEEVHAEMLAIMTDHESNMTGIFAGPFAQQVVNHSAIPILSVKPYPGAFTSPA